MAGGVQSGDLDVAKVEGGVVGGGRGYFVTVFPTDYGEGEVFENLDISACVVVVTGFV
jgi:hypothetical protein